MTSMQSPTTPASTTRPAAPEKGILLSGATVLDGLGGRVEGAYVWIRGERIAYAGPSRPDLPSGVRTLDMRGTTVLPGLIDTHIHCAGGDYFPGYESEPLELAVLRTAQVLRRTLWNGITTVRTAASRDWIDIQVRDAITLGLIAGPRVLASGRGITITGGHMHAVCLAADGPEQMRWAIREHARRGADSIKLMMSAGVATAGRSVQASQYDETEARMAVTEAHRAGRRVLTHAIGREAIALAVAAGVDSIDHGTYLDEPIVQQMRDRGTVLVPTFCPTYYYTQVREAEDWRIERSEQVVEPHRRSFELAMEHGVTIAMGSDCGAPSRMPNGRNALELRLMVEAGMDPGTAIRAGTSIAADLIGLPEIGRIQPGAVADVIAVRGDPLRHMSLLESAVHLVIQAGNIIRYEGAPTTYNGGS